jgi:hypothetical protein
MTLADVHVFEGWEVIATEAGGYAVRFRQIVGPDFVTRALEVDADGPRGLRRLSARRDPKGHWWADGKRRSDLDGCLDADVAATPLTNTPAIRRLGLLPGEGADLLAAWVDAPALSIVATEQRYERLADDGPDSDASSAARTARYRFVSGSFNATITTDPDGIVRDYEGFARRIFRR